MGQIHNSMRRSRGMRSNLSNTKDAKSISYTPKKVFKVNDSQPQGKNNASAYISFHPTNNKRSHTPLAYRKPKPANNKQYGGSSNKSSAVKQKTDSTSGIVHENLRLRLHKASRGVTLKHLSNLCTRSTPEIRHVMLSFCLLLNALKKKEYRAKPTVFRDWNYLCEYINKHNCTILAEVIAVANKIERELYDVEAMLYVQEHFETLQLQAKVEPSLKLVYTFIENAILFFKSKVKPNAYEEKSLTKQNNWMQERTITNRKSFHQHSKSKTSESSVGQKNSAIHISQRESQPGRSFINR